jgi:hypothetical protein
MGDLYQRNEGLVSVMTDKKAIYCCRWISAYAEREAGSHWPPAKSLVDFDPP